MQIDAERSGDLSGGREAVTRAHSAGRGIRPDGGGDLREEGDIAVGVDADEHALFYNK